MTFAPRTVPVQFWVGPVGLRVPEGGTASGADLLFTELRESADIVERASRMNPQVERTTAARREFFVADLLMG